MTPIMIRYDERHRQARKEPRNADDRRHLSRGSPRADARAKLVEDLTTSLLRAERAPDTEFFRNVTWVYVHELPEGAINAAATPVDEPTFRVMVTTPEGALSDRRRAEMVEAGTAAVLEAAGLGRRTRCASGS